LTIKSNFQFELDNLYSIAVSEIELNFKAVCQIFDELDLSNIEISAGKGKLQTVLDK